MIPVVLIFLTAFKPDTEIIQFSGFFPSTGRMSISRSCFRAEEIPIFRWLFNSVFIASSITLLVLTVDSLAAYGLSRLNLPGGKVIFAIILATLMVPGQVLLVPVYLILSRLGWLDTPLGADRPRRRGAFGVFLLSNSFKIPKELEEAAQLDGCRRLAFTGTSCCR